MDQNEDNTPQAEIGYTRIANEILTNLAKIDISGQCYQILLIIFRLTYGWGRNKTIITLDRFVLDTGGATKPRILKVIKQLTDRNIITKEKVKLNGSLYGFNKDPKKWILNNCQIVEKDNPDDNLNDSNTDCQIVEKDNAIVEKDNDYTQECFSDIVDDKKEVINKQNDSKNTTLYKEKDLFNSKELNTPKPLKVRKKTMLDSKNSALRLCGFWDSLFFKNNNEKFLHNYKKDITIFNRILNNYDEETSQHLIEIFFRWTKDENKWQYQKPALEVLIQSLPALLSEHKKHPTEKKIIISVENTDNKKIDFMSVDFTVMITDLKQQHGPLEAVAHIEEYKKIWFNNLQNFCTVLKKILDKKK